MRRAALALCLPLALAACDALSRRAGSAEPLARAVRSPAAPAASPTDARVAGARAERLAARLREGLGRRFPLPRKLDDERCDDARLRAAGSGDALELALTAVDERPGAKNVLPLVVTRALIAPEPAELALALEGIAPERAPGEALGEAEWLERRRYLGVYHVLDFGLPRRFHRPERRHAEWDAGRLDALFVIHDAASGAPLCQSRLTVHGDATGAPLAVRLRSDVRDRLTRALGAELRRRTPAALAGMSGALRLREAAAQ
ncbi:MAG: hypothetical protein OZ921_19860 [Sorangiineae bacterium]|nr:hypothetical protein [Polyangiaceae bacterium]MEB2324782.1 hypothetical protein [Sorangiineae bacterium]